MKVEILFERWDRKGRLHLTLEGTSNAVERVKEAARESILNFVEDGSTYWEEKS